MLTPSHVSFHQDCYHPRAYLAAMASATLTALATVRSLPCLSYVADAAICDEWCIARTQRFIAVVAISQVSDEAAAAVLG